MKSSLFLSSLLATLLSSSALSGCASDPVLEDSYPGTIKQESSTDFSSAQSCDAITPCPDGLECMYVDALDIDTPICVDAATICDALDCGDGECLLLESYPAQLRCSGHPGPDDGPGDDCTVASDGTSSCPDGNGDDGSDDTGGSEPGHPGPT